MLLNYINIILFLLSFDKLLYYKMKKIKNLFFLLFLKLIANLLPILTLIELFLKFEIKFILRIILIKMKNMTKNSVD